MIGNDIVDLNLAATESDWQRSGFLEKQFSRKEQKEILNSANQFEKVWLFWSMKEAAYKCYTQKTDSRFFNPRVFECSIIDEAKGIVKFKNLEFYTFSYIDGYYIHTTAEDELVENPNEINTYLGLCHPNKVDEEITKRLGNKLRIRLQEIIKRKTAIGAPQFYHQEKLLTKSCSISHHGNYGAYAFILNAT